MSFSFVLKDKLPGYFGIVKTLEALKTQIFFYCNCESSGGCRVAMSSFSFLRNNSTSSKFNLLNLLKLYQFKITLKLTSPQRKEDVFCLFCHIITGPKYST